MRLVPLRDGVPPFIEVFRVDVDLGRVWGEGGQAVWNDLTDAERRKVGRQRKAEDRARLAQTRAALRRVLAPRLGCRPADVPLARGTHGKPFVDAPKAPRVNVSHAGAHGLIAVADPRVVGEVGIDIELCAPGLDVDALLALACTQRECGEVREAGDRLDALYRCWVGKEAILKAIGVGVAEHLQCVGVHAAGPRGLVIDCAVPEWRGFTAVRLRAPERYAAALAWNMKE
ncbi:MAG: 4'-phosphopantetheinyl transferase superfamily protein [Acidovorax sp.]